MPSLTEPRLFQLFVDVNVSNDTAYTLPFSRTFREASACRLGAPRPLYAIPTTSCLRRVSWVLAPGVECSCALVQGQVNHTTQVAAFGHGSMAWTGDLSLHVIEAGWALDWHVIGMGLDGRATFSFDFEAADLHAASGPLPRRYSRLSGW